MPSPRRIEKINMLLKEEIADLLDREIEFSNDTIVTVTRARISPDGHYATVFISVLDDKEGPVFELLEKHLYGIQQLLNRRVRMRPVPKIRFAVDEEETRRERVEKSLADVKRKGQI